MKKRSFAIIISVLILLSAVFPVYAQPDDEIEPTLEGTEVNTYETAPTEELIAVSYYDYLTNQALAVFDNPELFVGETAALGWVWTVRCSADPAAIDYETLMTDEDLENQDDGICYLDYETFYDENGNSIRMVITDYCYAGNPEDPELWFKVEAAEGYTLPQEVVDNPYILYVEYRGDEFGSLSVLKAMFIGETVDVQKQPVAASSFKTITVANVPEFFDVTYVENEIDEDTPTWYGYDLGDVSSWEGITSAEYRYVAEVDWNGNYVIYLIPIEVHDAYEKLLGAEDKIEYNEIWNQIPDAIKEQFTDKHHANLDEFKESLPKGTVEYSTIVDYFGQDITVSVSGDLPIEGVYLSAAAVANETVLEEGFDVTAADIITALDIKIINNEDGTEWQPGEGETIAVSIDMTPFGYEESDIVKLYHKHDDTIQEFEIFIVIDGKVTVYTEGFSIYVVAKPKDDIGRNQAAIATPNNNDLELTVGDHVVYYVEPQYTDNIGTWEVIDTDGAIHYTVHSNSTIGNSGMICPWIEIYALREAQVTLRYNYYTNGNRNGGFHTETYDLTIAGPSATGNNANDDEENGKRLYLKDTVNTTGCITATLVDTSGKELSLDGAAFSWSRYDDVNKGNLFIVPAAYANKYQSVNIARDHAGLVESRVQGGKHVPVTYTCVATLADGTELSATYTVYYQSEILNAGFESPAAKENTYSFFPNGWTELFWKTTAPGSESTTNKNNVSKDVEYGNVKGNAANAGTSYGVTEAADYDSEKKTGYQFAELNAEAFGSLYQDIITAPGEDIEWEFAHAPRPGQSWASPVTNKMYIVIGATEDAQELLTQKQLLDLVRSAKVPDMPKDPDNDDVYHLESAVVEFDGDGDGDTETYYVWCHDAGTYKNGDKYNGTWTKLAGSYTVPDGQYRTRLFFVSEPEVSATEIAKNENAGNLIDAAKAGQYKTYLIEYYEESFNEKNEKTTTHIVERDEFGEALVYSAVPLKNLDYFVNEQNDYLHQILINGANYPYNIRYSGDPQLYIEKYPMSGLKDPDKDVGKDYANYDIVVQIYIRDTVVVVQKELVFPSALTEEQKLNIMNDVRAKGGYQSLFHLDSVVAANGEAYHAEGLTVITQRDPAGEYTGYISLGDNPKADGTTYTVEEKEVTELPGLILDTVTFKTIRYKYGETMEPDEIHYETIDGSKKIKSTVFQLTDTYKIADITVTNTYREKETTVHYKAIGNGKVAIADGNNNFEDLPSETLPYYSGVATGAAIYPGESNGAKAVFVGWYLDEACTEANKLPNESRYGVIDPITGTFRPNSNIIEQDEITFYAKFETSSITINRTGAEANQTFVYLVQGNTDSDDNIEITMYVTVTCDASGNGSCLISEVGAGEYTVTELEDWSWRYPGQSQSGKLESQVQNATEAPKLEFTFDDLYTNDYWLNGYSEPNRNMQGIGNTQGSGGNGG